MVIEGWFPFNGVRVLGALGLALNSFLLREEGVDAVEVGFAVADVEGVVVDVGDAGARGGVGGLR